MRIALLPDDYLPCSTRVHAKMLHELAVSLKKNGHHPVIITPGTPSQKSRLVIDYIDDVEVWRFRSGYIKGVGMLQRAVNEWLLSLRAWLAIKSKVEAGKRFDLCINYSPTIFFGSLAKRFKKKGAYVYLILRDLFPQWIIDQGLIREKSIAAYFFRYYEELNYKTSDCIGVMSQANLDFFSAKFPYCNNVVILRNWSATPAIPAKDSNKEFILEHGLKDKVIFFYGGNIGHAQDMENIMRLAKNMSAINEAHFLIIGQGDQFTLIHSLKKQWKLDNVTILPAMSQDKFKGILAVIDIGLFSLAYNHTAHNFPGKLLGYMVESKPILGSVNPGNDLATIINCSNSGFVYTNGDDDALFNAASLLLKDLNLRHEMGRNSRSLLLKEFSVESAVKNILKSVS